MGRGGGVGAGGVAGEGKKSDGAREGGREAGLGVECGVWNAILLDMNYDPGAVTARQWGR